jgi:hypothetical protein
MGRRGGKIEATPAVRDSCERSAAYVFGNASTNPVVDKILAALRGSESLSRNEIFDLFDRHKDEATIDLAHRDPRARARGP